MAKEKKSKKCSKGRRVLWYIFGGAGLSFRGLAALSLLAIAIMLCPLKQEASSFNACVEEVREGGANISSSVRFCNGGSN